VTIESAAGPGAVVVAVGGVAGGGDEAQRRRATSVEEATAVRLRGVAADGAVGQYGLVRIEDTATVVDRQIVADGRIV
jgi:hypothetical protein